MQGLVRHCWNFTALSGSGSLNHEKEITSNTLKAKKTKFKNVKESKKPMMIKKGGSLRGLAFKPSIIN